jgi:hypothetical protein
MQFLPNILAALAAFVLGFIWYNPKVFGTIWMRAAGITPDPKKINFPVMILVSLLVPFIVSMPLAYQVGHADEHLHPFVHGFFHGAVYMGLMVAAPIIALNSYYENRGWGHFLVGAGYWVVTLGTMGGIMAMFFKPGAGM